MCKVNVKLISNFLKVCKNNMNSNKFGDSRIDRQYKQGKVELDCEQSSLIVNFEVEVVKLDDNGKVLKVLDRTPEVRRIKIKSFAPDRNLALMAEEIISKCPYLHQSRLEEIEQLLIQLRKYLNNNTTNNIANSNNPNVSSNKPNVSSSSSNYNTKNDNADNHEIEKEKVSKPKPKKSTLEDSLPPSSLDELDDYLEMLYQVSGKSEKEREECLQLQIRGTAMILQLCRNVMNLESLIQNNTVMGALTRVLQDEHKKSIDLTYNILRIFLAFSNFYEMHEIMANHKIGFLTMKVIDYELKRTEYNESELKTLTNESSNKSKTNDIDLSSYAVTQRKQNKLLFVCLYILINLANDVIVEKKMIKKDLLVYILTILSKAIDSIETNTKSIPIYHNSNLLILCLSFLRKITIYEENKNYVKDSNIIQKFVKLLSCSSVPLVIALLRLLFNLSFDKDIREQIIKGGMIPKLVHLFNTSSYRARLLKLFYHLSTDDRCKSMITYTEAIPILNGMIINFPQPQLTKELAAVMINLSLNSRNVELMLQNNGLNHLMDRLESNKDVLLLKIIRNITLWSFNLQKELENPEVQYRYRGLWSPHIKIFLKLCNENENHDILVEVFGCLANFTVHDLPTHAPWLKIIKESTILSIISKLLVPGMAQNDLVLEIIMLIGSMASDEKACDLIASSTIINLLYQTWKERSDDLELKLQLIHTFYKLILFEKSREEVLYSTRIVTEIIDCLSHKKLVIRSHAEKFCDLVMEFDRQKNGILGKLGQLILKKRFESYNDKWLKSTEDNSSFGRLGLIAHTYSSDGKEDHDDMSWLQNVAGSAKESLDIASAFSPMSYQRQISESKTDRMTDDSPSDKGDGW